MVNKAMDESWTVYQDVTIPVNGWYSAWMVKPISSLDNPPPPARMNP
jgi:hypothetical protein